MGRYAKYKDSGLEWIGEIPSHWACCKTLYALSMPITDGPHETPELFNDGIPFVSAEAVSSGNGRIDFSHIRGYISEEYYRECCKKYVPELNDIYMIKSGATTGSVALVDTDEIFTIWSPLAVFRCKASFASYKFLFYFLQSDGYQKQVENMWSYGTQQNIGMRTLEKLKICVPPLTEQEIIADYLDSHTLKIDTSIANLKSQFSMLTRYKRDLIAQCVTKGLDKTAPMKSSGEDWIGDVPEHWNITKLKWMFEIVKRIHGKEDRDVLAITQQGIKRKDMESNKGQYAESYDTYQVVNVNDFAMNSMDLLTGWVDCSPYEGVTSPDYRVFRFHEDKPQCHAYFKYLFQMCYTNRIFYRLGQGVSNLGRWRLQTDQFRNIKLPQPPVKEQERIAAYLDKKTRQIDAVAADIEAQIQKLKDYRRILIHDAVTGKIKV